jgi:predicted nucleic acid-binding protein
MTKVVDASVALKWVVDEPGSGAADALLTESLIAPDFWLIEAANVLRTKTMRGDLIADQARIRLDNLRRAPVVSMSTALILNDALALAIELEHSVYDCLYLALALREDAVLVTADRRFHAVAQRSTTYALSVQLLDG